MRLHETRQIVRLNSRDMSGRTASTPAADYFAEGRLSSGSGHLPTYDSAVYNQPPPSYEEAIKIKAFVQSLTTPSATDQSAIPMTTSIETTAFMPQQPKDPTVE